MVLQNLHTSHLTFESTEDNHFIPTVIGLYRQTSEGMSSMTSMGSQSFRGVLGRVMFCFIGCYGGFSKLL